MHRARSTNMREDECIIRYWWEIQKERGCYEDQDVGECITSKWILERYNELLWTGSICLRIGPVEGLCEESNEL
jgi:hypothetical protein